LITQLTNQDPMEPTSNEELLRQISSIREIELSSTLTESLRNLTGQQQVGSAAGLIGQYVTGTDSEGVVSGGMVTAVKFGEGGQAMLQLSTGLQIPLSQMASIQSPIDAAAALVGKKVTGIARLDGQTGVVEGVVTGVAGDSRGEPKLELDTGEALSLRDVLEIGEA